MAKTKIFGTSTDNLPTIFRKIIFHEINPKSFSEGFLTVFKFPENFPKTYREYPEKIIAQKFYQKHFHEFYNFPKFSENFVTILVNMRFQFCLAAKSIRQDGPILSDNQPIKLRESKAG